MGILRPGERTKYTNKTGSLHSPVEDRPPPPSNGGGDRQKTRALLFVDHHPPGVHLLVRSISCDRFLIGVVCTTGDLLTHDGSGSRLCVEQLWFGVFHCSSPLLFKFPHVDGSYDGAYNMGALYAGTDEPARSGSTLCVTRARSRCCSQVSSVTNRRR
jgi:hypothetical protein